MNDAPSSRFSCRLRPSLVRLGLALALVAVLPALHGAFPAGKPVSPLLLGQNLWLNPPDSAYTVIDESGIALMRIGGITYDNNPLPDATLLRQVDNIRAIGAEPVIQVSRHKGAAAAAATVTYLNVTHGRAVKYWCIGNEPDINWQGTETGLAAFVATYIKEIAPAMRDVDPGLHLSGPEMAFYSSTKFQALLGGASDIAGRDAKGRFYLNTISFHRYPFNDVFTRTGVLAEMHSGLESTVTALTNQVAFANTRHARTGADALTWSLTEFNQTYRNPPVSTNHPAGLGVSSFLNGQFFAEYYRVGMKHGALTMATWSLQEGGGNGSITDFGYIGGSWASPVRRSSFHHMKLVADYLLPGGYLAGTTSTPNLAVLGTSTASGTLLAVMLMNQNTTTSSRFTLRMNTDPVVGDGVRINVDAGLAREFSGTLGAQSTVVLQFDEAGELRQRSLYSLDLYQRNLPPQISTFPQFTRAPEAPVELTATQGDGRVTLHWISRDATSVTVLRGTAREGPFAVVGAGVLADNFTDTGLPNGTPVFYVVKALNPVGESPVSLPVEAIPEAASGVTTAFEAEALAVVSEGSSTSVNAETGASGGSWVQLNASAAGPSVEFTTGTVPAGRYQLQLAYKANPNRGQCRITVDGVTVGGTFEQYASTTRFTSWAVGEVVFPTSGPRKIRLTVTGTNPAATGHLLSADRFTFAAAEAAEIRLGGLRQTFDGAPKSVTVTTVPAGLPVVMSYPGSPTAPTLPGAYPVVAMVNDSRYTGTTRSTLVIAAAEPEASRLSNLSVRTPLSARQVLTVGLTLQGGEKSVLLRAAGPSLAAFGVGDPMADPGLVLFQSSNPIAANDQWGGDAAIGAAASAVGAFAFSAPSSLDAALLTRFDGGRTVQVSGPTGGTVLVEAYDAGPGANPRLTNLSALNQVGTGGNLLIAGFTVAGSGTKTTLIRVVGPGLTPFGVPGLLADPRLELFTAAQPPVRIAVNDTHSPTLAGVAARVGAFALPPGSKDAALLIQLAPGGYTVQASGADGGTGNAIVEVYEVP